MIYKRYLATEDARPCLGVNTIRAYNQIAAGGRAVGESDGGCLAVYLSDSTGGMDSDGQSGFVWGCGLVLESVVKIDACQ